MHIHIQECILIRFNHIHIHSDLNRTMSRILKWTVGVCTVILSIIIIISSVYAINRRNPNAFKGVKNMFRRNNRRTESNQLSDAGAPNVVMRSKPAPSNNDDGFERFTPELSNPSLAGSRRSSDSGRTLKGDPTDFDINAANKFINDDNLDLRMSGNRMSDRKSALGEGISVQHLLSTFGKNKKP